MQAVNLDGVTLNAAVTGPRDGPALVFSNSLGTDYRIWDEVMARMPEGLRVLRSDKRGHGLSDCPSGDWGVEAHVDDLIGLMDHFGLSRTVICGLSVGGLIAQGLAARRPDLVRGLILCDTAAKIGTAEMWNSRIEAIEAGGIAALADGILERWFSPRFRAEEPDFPLWRSMLVRTPVDGYLNTARGIRDTDYSESTAKLSLPLMAICGELDGATPPDVVRATAALVPGGVYHEIPGVGHLPCIETPDEVSALILGFLRDTGHI